MRILFSGILAAAALSAAPALAWNESMTQPATDEVAVFAYPAKANYCPAGLQPVVVGGVICCGVPTHQAYKAHRATKPRKPAPTYISLGKGYDDGVVVYEKGQ